MGVLSFLRAPGRVVIPRGGMMVLLAIAFCGPFAAGVAAREEQAHGLVFEHWVADTFFGGWRSNNQRSLWDIPAAANRLPDPRFAGLPVNPKFAKLGSAVGLGDALRQFSIDEPFVLVLGYWVQEDAGAKRPVKILAARVEPSVWRALWGEVKRTDLEWLDAMIKDRGRAAKEIQELARQAKTRQPFSGAVLDFNPKIDGKGQRRLQVSLRYRDVPRLFPGAERVLEQAGPSLWGVEFPGVIPSGPRGQNRGGP